MIFLKIMFWMTIMGFALQTVYCMYEHPRHMSNSMAVDVLALLGQIIVAVFYWGYAFGGWPL
jgi:hypothetical protein